MKRKPEKHKPTIEYKKLSEAISTNMKQYSRPPIILDKPFPKPNFASGSSRSDNYESWIAKLKVELFANGQIGNITVYSHSSRSYVESCVEAIKNLKFIPAQVNGKNVDSVNVIDYTIKTYTTKSVRVTGFE